jgi:ADP-heptose:LPS heptosyltransferase
MNTKERAILFRIGGLGDLLVALPAIALVRRNLPGFSLTLVGRPEYGELLKLAGVVDEILSFEEARMTAVFSGSNEAVLGATNGAGPVASWLKEYSLAMGWLNRPGDWPARDWWKKQGVGRVDFTVYESGPAVPMSRFFFNRTRDFLKTIGIRVRVPGQASGAGVFGKPCATRDVSAKAPDASAFYTAAPDLDEHLDECSRLALPAGLKKIALADLRLRELAKDEKRLVVHPGSGGRAKRWPLANFVEIIRHVSSRGLTGVLVTGEAEADYDSTLNTLALPAGWMRVSRLPAAALAALLSASTHYLGNDSGPTHLAAACGASVLALFRNDNLPAWRPFGKTRVLSAPATAGIPVDSVLAALAELLAA